MNMRRILTIVVIAGSALYAQRRGFEPRGSSGTSTPPTPAQIVQRETDRLTRFFNLTTTQQGTVLGILTSAVTQTEAITAQIQPLRTTLVAAIKANNQSEISAIAPQISSLQGQELAIRANAAGEIYSTVLTTTQQAQVGSGVGPLLDGGAGLGGLTGPGR
jgi:hypothetical protein